jgi:hypothetical protein
MADTLHSEKGTLGTSNSDLIDAVPSSTTETVIGLILSNVNSSSQDVTVDIEVVKSGGSVHPHILNDITLPFGTSLKVDTKIVLEAGDSLRGLSNTASSVDFVVSYLRQT